MDEADLRIIETLAKNSRASFRRIAKELGVSTDTVIRRYQRLEKEGEIQPTITVDYVKLGFEALAYFAVRVFAKSDVSKIIEEIAKIPNVTTIMKATGSYDLLLVTCVRSMTHAFKIGEEIEAKSGTSKVDLDLFWPPQKGEASFPPTGWHNLHKEAL